MAPGVIAARETTGKCSAMASAVPPEASKKTMTAKIARRHPARSSRSFQKMAVARVTRPSGGARWDRGEADSSGFCSSVMNSFRFAVFGIALEPRKVILIAPRYGVARHEPIHGLADHPGHCVGAAHAYNRLLRGWQAGTAHRLDLPTFHT